MAGVSYQIAVGVMLLAAARDPDSGMPVVTKLRPEGFEDIDCQLADGTWLLVQCKQRSTGRSPIGVAELADILVHASVSLLSRDYDGDVSGLVVVTSGRFPEDISPTGWQRSLGDRWPTPALAPLIEAVRTRLGDAATQEQAESIVRLARLVVADAHEFQRSSASLATEWRLSHRVANLVRAELFADLAALGARQRGENVASALTRSQHEVDALVQRVQLAADTGILDEAIESGVCEIANYLDEATISVGAFYAGVRVGPSHIAAGLDVVRAEEQAVLADAAMRSRNVIVAAQSGAGKSTLMWRWVASLTGGEIAVRLLRVATHEDVSILVRFVRHLDPAEHRPVVVCVDDLGRPNTAEWAMARDQLLELPHVRLVATCRNDEFTPGLAVGATVVNAELTVSSAEMLYERMRQSGLELAVESEEALQLASGLLMEFIAIATTGRRLREVLAEQLQRLEDAGQTLAIETLRVVVSLHQLGRKTRPDELSATVDSVPTDIGRALRVLRDEHLVLIDDGDAWTAIHDLRAETLEDLLHESPPPTRADSYVSCIAAAPLSDRPSLYRRALSRLLREATSRATTAPAGQRLDRTQRLLSPIRNALVRDVRLAKADGSATVLRGLFESAQRCDVVAYVSATRDDVCSHAQAAVDRESFYLMAFAKRFSGISLDLLGLESLDTASNALPDWSDSSAIAVLREMPWAEIADILKTNSLEDAADFCETLEGYEVDASPSSIAEVLQSHAVASDDIEGIENRSRLIASLFRLGNLTPEEASTALGPVVERAIAAVAADDFALSCTVRRRPIAELPTTMSAMVRVETVSPEEFLEVDSSTFFRRDSDPVLHRSSLESATHEKNPSNAQVMQLVRRLFNACPEADVVTARVIDAAGAGFHSDDSIQPDGYKRIRAGVVPRHADTQRNVAVGSVVAELAQGERWSRRLRAQREVVVELTELLGDLPSRLSVRDNASRRRLWLQRVASALRSISSLPGVPPTSASSVEQPQATRSIELDGDLRERSKDRAKAGLETVASAMLQGVGAERTTSRPGYRYAGSAMRLFAAASELVDARAQYPMPLFAGIGEVLPDELINRCRTAARALSAADLPEFPGGSLAFSEVDSWVNAEADRRADQELTGILDVFGASGIVARGATFADEDPTVPRETRAIVVAVREEDVGVVGEILSGSHPAFAGTCRLFFLSLSEEVVIGGWYMSHQRDRTFPLGPETVHRFAENVGAALPDGRWTRYATEALTVLTGVFGDRVRMARRPAHWPAPRHIERVFPDLPVEGPASWGVARQILLQMESHIHEPDADLSQFVGLVESGNPFAQVDPDDQWTFAPVKVIQLAAQAGVESAPQHRLERTASESE
ncbi:hypothetical protein AKG07_03200 [Microbacterium sp. CGR1]|nr:hypothetical protein AKG07_03200 [Microbacterium sp. CGR1]